MVELRKAYGPRFLWSIRYLLLHCDRRLFTYLEVALLFRIRIVVPPPLGGHGLELKHGGCDVSAIEIDYGSREHDQRAGEAAMK